MPRLKQSYCAAGLSILATNVIPSRAWSSERRLAVRCYARAAADADDEPLFDLEARNGTPGFEMPLDMLVGRIDEDGGLISLWGDRRRFEPVPGESAVLFSFPMTAGRNLMLSENCRWGDYSHEQWHAQPGTTAGCAILPSIPGQRTGRAVCPCTEKTHWCGSFKLRSDVGSEPDQEEC